MLKSSEKVKGFLEELYGKSLSDEEVREYKERTVRFFGLLVEIDKRTKRGNR